MKMKPILENSSVALFPLQADHWKRLWPAAQGIDLNKYGATDISTPEKLKAYVLTALKEQMEGKSIPFIIYDKARSTFIGSTRYGNIDARNKVLHIGWTWISIESQGTGINKEVKHLMLDHAFRDMDFEKVEFRIDERNIRSRKAVEKLGAQLEGVLRRNLIVKDGYRRNSCCYGILREEWLHRDRDNSSINPDPGDNR